MNYEKICASTYTYESDDQVDNVLEQKLGKYESKIEPIIDDIINNCMTNNFSVSKEDQQELFQYLWLQYLRTDAGRILLLIYLKICFLIIQEKTSRFKRNRGK